MHYDRENPSKSPYMSTVWSPPELVNLKVTLRCTGPVTIAVNSVAK